MQIIHVVHSFDLSGRSRLIHDICRILNGGEFGFTIASLTDKPGYRQQDMECVCLGKRPGFDPALIVRLARLMRARRSAVVHSHGRGAVPYVAGARALARGRRWVHTVHRADGDAVSGPPWLRRWIVAGMARVVGVSDAARREFARLNDIALGRTTTIYNGIDVDHFSAATMTTTRSGGPVIGTVANLSQD